MKFKEEQLLGFDLLASHVGPAAAWDAIRATLEASLGNHPGKEDPFS